jgi:glycerophosphoryl diester phosphodiesterase
MPARFIRAVACRGASRAQPENTRRAFDAALRADADELHADVRVTKDGVAVLCQDASLFRTTGKEALVKDLAVAELLQLEADAHLPSDRATPTRIPTLDEFVSRYLPKASLVLELKEAGTVLATVTVLQKLAADGSFEKVLAVSTERSLLSALRGLDSRVRLGQILERRSTTTFAEVKLFGASVVLLFWEDAANKNNVDDAHRLGLTVYAWGAEKFEDAKQAVAGGADAVIYDHPAELAAHLKESGLHDAATPAPPSSSSGRDTTVEKNHDKATEKGTDKSTDKNSAKSA